MSKNPTAILLIECPDQAGIVAKITGFLTQHTGNIIDLEQHVDHEDGHLFMRVEWELEQFQIHREDLDKAFAEQVASQIEINWQINFSDQKPRLAIFVSQHGHCLFDLLSRYQLGEWFAEIPLIISNHETFRNRVESAGIDFHYLPITSTNKAEQEQRQLQLLADNNIDTVVLARYMQIISENFIQHFPNKIINIHHSFLPAFPGAKPYHSAYERGVKIIGATSHYVTSDLDAGPIIEQDVIHVRHNDSIEDLKRKGRDNEKIVLARAIRRHLHRQILVYKNRCVVFD